MYQRQGSDIEIVFKLAEHLQKQSRDNRRYRARLFKEIHTEAKEEKNEKGEVVLSSLTPQEVLARVIELCMEADYLRRLPPDLINELSDILEGIQLMETSDSNLQELIDTRLARFRKLCRYIANIAYAKPEKTHLDLEAMAAISKSSKRREIIG